MVDVELNWSEISGKDFVNEEALPDTINLSPQKILQNNELQQELRSNLFHRVNCVHDQVFQNIALRDVQTIQQQRK